MKPELNIPNLDKLIAHLEAQPAERFSMLFIFTLPNGDPDDGTVPDFNDCGTAACLAGDCILLSGAQPGSTYDDWDADAWLGLTRQQGDELFTPDGFGQRDRYPIWRAIATLKRLRDHYLATGEVVVDWGPEPGAEPAQPWTAPQITEQTPPLPSVLTRFLAAEREEV